MQCEIYNILIPCETYSYTMWNIYIIVILCVCLWIAQCFAQWLDLIICARFPPPVSEKIMSQFCCIFFNYFDVYLLNVWSKIQVCVDSYLFCFLLSVCLSVSPCGLFPVRCSEYLYKLFHNDLCLSANTTRTCWAFGLFKDFLLHILSSQAKN